MSLQNLTVIRECIFNPRLLFKIQLLSKIQSVHTVISFLKEYLHINNYWQAYTKIKKSGQAYTKMPAFILFNRYYLLCASYCTLHHGHSDKQEGSGPCPHESWTSCYSSGRQGCSGIFLLISFLKLLHITLL